MKLRLYWDSVFDGKWVGVSQFTVEKAKTGDNMSMYYQDLSTGAQNQNSYQNIINQRHDQVVTSSYNSATTGITSYLPSSQGTSMSGNGDISRRRLPVSSQIME